MRTTVHRRLRLRTNTATACALGTLGGLVLFAPSATAGAPAPAAGTAVPAAAVGAAPATEDRGDYDARVDTASAGPAMDGGAQLRTTTAPGRRALRALPALRAALGDQLVADLDPLTGTPRQLARLDGMLTGPARGAARGIALSYVRAHEDVFNLSAGDLAGLRLQRDYVDVEGTHHLSWVQTAGGVELFGNGLQANVARDGSLVSVLGSPVPGLTAPTATKRLDGAAALRAARTDLGTPATGSSGDRVTPVLFQLPDGTRPAWETITMSAARPALHVVDAATGRVLYRRSLTSDATDPSATGTAYQYFPKAPRGGVQERIDFTRRGWLKASATKLAGNNAHAYADVDDDDTADPAEQVPPRSAHSWNYRLTPFPLANAFCGKPYPCSWDPDKPYSWQVNRNQNATQVFAYVNQFHDHLLAQPIGFTEAAGNFEKVNSSGKGAGGDAVEAQSDDGADTDHGLPDAGHVDNANMTTPPDGQAPRMQMYLQHLPGTSYPEGDPFAQTNVGDEADTVYHEYTHGLSNRLVVDARGNSGLTGEQGGAMGEAWSDWYAMDYLVAQGLQTDTAKDGDVVLFQYDGAGVAVDRTEPLDCKVGVVSRRCQGTEGAGGGGYTYGDLGKVVGAPEVHADGEIWAQTLWDLRDRLGSAVSESLVTRAMELSPVDPSFLDMRNAILQADNVVYGGGHRSAVWKVFAARGMGFFAAATSGDDTAPVQSFAPPPAPGTAKGSLSGHVEDRVTGKPVAGAVVSFGGHASGFPGDYRDVTDAAGAYRIRGILTGTYPKVTASAPGFTVASATITVHEGVTSHRFRVRRDFAAASGGGRVTATNDRTGEPYGCGPDAIIDQSQGQGWSAARTLSGSTVVGKHVTIKLPVAVDVGRILVDPTATCGDGGSASTGPYLLETSRDGRTWTRAAAGTFTPQDRGHFSSPALAAASRTAVRYVRYTMKDSQATQVGTCPGAFSGCDYVDSSELLVFGRRAGT